MIREDKAHESKNEFPRVNEDKASINYEKAKVSKKLSRTSKISIFSFVSICLVALIAVFAIPLLFKDVPIDLDDNNKIDNNEDVDDNEDIGIDDETDNIDDTDNNEEVVKHYWNNIKYLSAKAISINQAMVIAVKGNTVELGEEETNAVLNTNVYTTPIDTIMLSNNKSGLSYFSNNVEIVNGIRNLIDLEYYQVDIYSNELDKYINLMDNGYTVALEINEKYSLNFIFLQNGEIIIFDQGFLVSETKIDYNLFLALVDQIIAENDSYESNVDPSTNLDEIDVSGMSPSILYGYDKLDLNDYSTTVRKYYKSYKVKVLIDSSSADLIRNKLTGETFIPGTNISFKNPDEYDYYLAKDLGFDQYEDLNVTETPFISFNINNLDADMIEYLLKINTLKIVKKIYIYNDHYYGKLEGPKMSQIIFGGHSRNYLLFNNFEELRDALIEHKLYIYSGEHSKLEKYDEEFFKDNFLYFVAVRKDKQLLENLEVDVIQDNNIVTFNEIKTSSTSVDNDYNAIYAIEVKRIDGYSPYDYLFNGKPVSDKIVTLSVEYENEVFTCKVNSGDTINLNFLGTFVSLKGNRIEKRAMSFDDTFINVFNDFVIEEDTTVHLLTTDHNTYLGTGVSVKRVYIIYTPDASKNIMVLFDETSPISKSILMERTGLNIDKLYKDCLLTEEMTFIGYMPSSYVLWATGNESNVNRNEIDQLITPITYAIDGQKYGARTTEEGNWAYRESRVYDFSVQYRGQYYRFANEYPVDIGVDGDTLWFSILRRAMNPSAVFVDYNIKHIAEYDNEAIVVMQIKYQNYKEQDIEPILCNDFFEVKGLKEILDSLGDKKITFTIDDPFYKDDFYANVELNDIVHTEYDRSKFSQHIVYGKDLEWYDITSIYDANIDRISYIDGSYNEDFEKFTKHGFIDYEKSDLNFIKEIFGQDFDFDNNYILVIDRYGQYKEPHISSYSIRPYYSAKIELVGYRVDILDLSTTERKSTRFVEIIRVPKKEIARYNGDFSLELSIYSNNRATRSSTYTLNGDLYGVNELLDTYQSNYKLGDEETVKILDGYSAYKDIYLKFKMLMGYYPAVEYIDSWSTMDPWFYIERTANNSSEINAIYKLVGYDSYTKTLTFSRSFVDVGEDYGNKQICYDLIQLRGYAFFDVHMMPKNLKIIITEE